MLYACSLSSKTIIYKGMLACEQVLPFYPDLTDPDYETHLAMVHSRFATITFPSWDRAQPAPMPQPQRRDQHLARQPKCDARASGRRAERALRGRAAEGFSGRRARDVGLRHIR